MEYAFVPEYQSRWASVDSNAKIPAHAEHYEGPATTAKQEIPFPRDTAAHNMYADLINKHGNGNHTVGVRSPGQSHPIYLFVCAIRGIGRIG
jgi:hypothetical protein